ncbi:hypothetical protein E3T26_11730 [Cryobacterium sp. TMT1-21]|uniref:Mucin-associated surface protein n=1 Tax=Cryobacterium shii TaxID=1259235 RepID=A0AAQ2C7L3_9MICO|nr:MULTISPECIES: hypothetical protein [Cryobacterium]TFC50145.1 hypothetical protein E3O49_05155 [Cryobacterium shii]TFC82497.1 hypothetical protein E3T24_13255 [Cryobacterium sp. TmT2-59]TFD12157.1 hypothetical protein E3T26_11730 [Cryobacterium sp. TMT1-21]TFD19690.1 hypothetical protein E3T42_03865 [Cryobacterium sp. TMT4-10]TFD20643.1 hypothetical protein E3T32_08645 [Cryobacterium sp. TMT2-23]
MTHGPRLTLALATVFLVAATLTGCSNTPPALDPAIAGKLQSGVQEVSTDAAAGDFEGAKSALVAVQADLLTAAAAGQVTAERSAQVQSALNVVSADLDAAIIASKPEPTVAPAPAATADPGQDTGKDNGKDTCKKKDDNCDD